MSLFRMNLKELAKQVLKVDRKTEIRTSEDEYREWELKEEIMNLGSQIDDLKRLIEDLSYENRLMQTQIEGMELLLRDLQIVTNEKENEKLGFSLK